MRKKPMTTPTADEIRQFFSNSDVLDYLVLRPLSHITSSWEAKWEPSRSRYEPEPGTFTADLNAVIELIATCDQQAHYHEHENSLVERVISDGWPIQKKRSRWIVADYPSILERGAFRDLHQQDIISAASGRVSAALLHNQMHIDGMENGHRTMLTALMSIIIYHRYCDGSSLFDDAQE